jgi:hypothetical protein
MGQSLFEQAQAKSHRLRQKLKELLDQWLDQWLTICFVSRECWNGIQASFHKRQLHTQNSVPPTRWAFAAFHLVTISSASAVQQQSERQNWPNLGHFRSDILLPDTVNSLLRPSLLQAII